MWVGPYRIIRLINRGGQGQVYLGQDPRLGRRVAIKVHRLPAARRSRRAALREARLLAQLRDERIVQVHDVVESTDYLALVMEYVPGCDLEQLLGHVELSLSSILTIATDLTAALAAARRSGIVHGDLKAANVLVTERGRAKLSDFGIAGAALNPRDIPGSISALAPEQVTGDPLDVRTDLFALGRLVFRMLTGEHSFAVGGTPSVQALLQQEPPLLDTRMPPDREVPAELSALVQSLLHRDPDQRPANTHQVRRALRQVSRSQPLMPGADLLRQARPHFRSETPGDIPLGIPGELGRAGRSRNERAALRRRWLGLLPSSRTGKFGLALATGLTVVALALVLRTEPLQVHVREPVLAVQAGAKLAREVDAAFLVTHVGDTLRERRGNIRLGGAIAPRSLFTGTAGRGDIAQLEQLAIQVNCSTTFCLLHLERTRRAKATSYQQLLLSSASAGDWREGLRRGLAGLYP